MNPVLHGKKYTKCLVISHETSFKFCRDIVQDKSLIFILYHCYYAVKLCFPKNGLFFCMVDISYLRINNILKKNTVDFSENGEMKKE